MEKTEILSRNKAIAEFMQAHFTLNEYNYHYSWDWLMPVVEKIESLGYETFIRQNYCNVINTEIPITIDIKSYEETKIEAVFIACSDFAMSYNKLNVK